GDASARSHLRSAQVAAEDIQGPDVAVGRAEGRPGETVDADVRVHLADLAEIQHRGLHEPGRALDVLRGAEDVELRLGPRKPQIAARVVARIDARVVDEPAHL